MNEDKKLRLMEAICQSLLDYARLRLSRLKKRGLLNDLMNTNESPKEEHREDVIAAFEFGFAAAELRLKDVFEDAILEGFRLQEGREFGLAAARDARIRLGNKRRKAVTRAAKDLYNESPELLRNDNKTAGSEPSSQPRSLAGQSPYAGA